MPLDLSNFVSAHAELTDHVGCEVEVVGYGTICELSEADILAGRDDDCSQHSHTFMNVAIQCETHGEILVDFDHPDLDD